MSRHWVWNVDIFYWFLQVYFADIKKHVVFLSATYVGSTSDIIATSPPPPAYNTNNHNQLTTNDTKAVV